MVPQDLLETRVTKDHQEKMAHPEQMDYPVHQELQEKRDPAVH